MYYCVDIGGSLIKIGIIDESKIIEKDNLEVPKSFDDLICLIVENIKKFEEKYVFEGICISAPGSVAVDEGVIYGASALPYIHGPNFKVILKDKTGYDVSIENDANCAALAEVNFGNAKDNQNVAFVVVGTGVGGALIRNKKIIHGNHLHGGEIGYTILERRNGEFLSFSRLGSVGGMLKSAKNAGLDVKNGKELFALNNEVSLKIIDDFFHYLAVGIYNLQYTFDPEVILISGAISEKEGFKEEIEKRLDVMFEQLKDSTILPKIEYCLFKNDANLIGAYCNFVFNV